MQTGRLFWFPPFHLDVENARLWQEDTAVSLRPKAFAVLRYLAEHSERLVNREELVRAVWGETKVSEGVLRGCLREVRQALGDSVEAPQFIETVGRQGWRFLAPLNSVPPFPSSKLQGPSPNHPPLQDVQHLSPESGSQEARAANLPPLATVVFPAPVAVGELEPLVRHSDHIPVNVQPPHEACNEAPPAKQGTTCLTTDVQPLDIPSLLQSASKKDRGKIATVVMGLLLVGGVIVTLQIFFLPGLRKELPLSLPNKPSILVLPFANLSSDPNQEYLSDGITADLINDLSQVPDLFVIAYHSAFIYKGKIITARQINRELGVRYVIEGSISKINDRLRIRVQLIDATTDFLLWAERYDRDLKDLFTLQDEVTSTIVTMLALQFPLWEKGWAVRKHTHGIEAYDLPLPGVNQDWLRPKEANN